MILDVVFADELEQATAWREEADRRRALWPDDPVATVFAYCAGELEERVRRQRLRTAQLTVEEFANLHRVSPPSVRRWLKQGRVHGVKTSDGWVIARDAKLAPVKKTQRQALAA